MFSFYEVGGKVRDELMGLKSKDIDYVAVPSQQLLIQTQNAEEMFRILYDDLKLRGFEIFLSTKDCYTIRAKFPINHKHAGIVADFVMARKEIGYEPGTRKPIVVPGSLYDDLERRDFTVNAIAKNENGTLIDPFNGQEDIKNKILKTPLRTKITFDDDPLRILRAIRFHITKGFRMDFFITDTIENYDYNNKMKVVSEERIREELYKCFKFDTSATLRVLGFHLDLSNYIFTKTKLWLKPTNEQ